MISKEFFEEYRRHYNAFNDYLVQSAYRTSVFNIPQYRDNAENEKAEKPIRDFVKRLLGRIVFLYFVQKKGWMESYWPESGNLKPDYAFMSHLFKFADKKKDFYSTYLVPLFFETLSKRRKDDVYKADKKDLGKVPYLAEGLFEIDGDGVETIAFRNELFENLFNSLNSYNFTLVEDSPGEREVAVDPEMLGHIFENLLEENKKYGTFYTPKEVVHFMAQEALFLHLSKKLKLKEGTAGWKELKHFVQHKEQSNFIKKHKIALENELDSVKVCDPAIGSGAFPMGILLEIFQMKLQLYAITDSITSFAPAEVKEKIIRNSIYGMDIDKGAIDTARLRFWLSLMVDLDQPGELPNFDHNFMQGDSLKEEDRKMKEHVFYKGGFDIVIANPPYGVPVDDTFYKKSNLGSKDSYGFFIQLAIDTLLKKTGTMVFIVSDTWLTIKSHVALRKLVLKNQVHKIVRLHPDTFGAVVNTCIVSLSKQAPAEDDTLIAADLTNLSTRKNTPGFREKLWRLENHIGEFNERYAVYKYPQHLIQTNSNLPILTASPKLFALMNNVTCEKKKKKLVDGEEEKQIELRKIKINGKEIELVRFGDVANVKQGLATGDNHHYLFQNPEAHGSYRDINLYRAFLLTKNDLEKINRNENARLKVIELGIHQSKDEKNFDKDRWLDGRYIVPYDKGGESDTNEGWLPNYYVPTNYFIDWSTQSVKRLKTYTIAQRIRDKGESKQMQKHYSTTIAAVLRNVEKSFLKSITSSRVGIYSPTFRTSTDSLFDSGCSNIFSTYYNRDFLLGLLCSKLIRLLFKEGLNHTVNSQADDMAELALIANEDPLIANIVSDLVNKQRQNRSYPYFSFEQKEIDRLVYELYGLNEADIQDVEYWWARRYPKLARFADTKPRPNPKDAAGYINTHWK